jgi:glutaredoxin
MKIEIYTIPTCPWCTKLKDWLKKKKISYEEKDLSESQNGRFRNEILDKSSQLAVPTLDIDGQIIVGFHEDLIESALAKAGKR